jgi:hypothetical protein
MVVARSDDELPMVLKSFVYQENPGKSGEKMR